MLNRLSVAVLMFVFVAGAFAANIAIVDSGMDYKHKELKNSLWTNPTAPNITDADGTVYKNVIYGWNFPENNNQVIDYSHLGTFSADCYKIFTVQAKVLRGTATQEEQDWYKSKKEDENFIKELSKFGNFIHGTHVSGISAKDAPEAHLVAQKIIPTEQAANGTFSKGLVELIKAAQAKRDADNPIAKMLLDMLASRQSEFLVQVGKFVAATKADVANGSFGTSVAAIKPVIQQLLSGILGQEELSDEDVEAYAIYFIERMTEMSIEMATSASDTLFVFAAGNDGTDNDSLPVSPANIKADNTIAVAATLDYDSLAKFSNFGRSMVEVAAPGVEIEASIPGDEYLSLSGTSMAAPHVTNIAGLVKDANPALSPKEIKDVLMQTVDIKGFLTGKVASGGIVNRTRAVSAARKSRHVSLEAAIRFARSNVADQKSRFAVNGPARDLIVLPLPMLFQ